jgi:hypothetical protein
MTLRYNLVNNFVHYEHDETGIDRSRIFVLVLTSDKQVIHWTFLIQVRARLLKTYNNFSFCLSKMRELF